MRRIGGNYPKTFDFSLLNSPNNLVISPAVLGRNLPYAYSQETRDLLAIGRFQELMTTQQVGRIGKQAGTHRVALAGNRVCPGTRAPDISSHEREVDNRLRCAGSFVALIDAHGPPERNAFAGVNGLREFFKLLDR